MTSPLERAARALHEATRQVRYIRDCTQPDQPPVERAMPFTEWADLTDAARAAYGEQARSLLELLRELHDDAIIDQMSQAAKAADTIASASGWKGEPYRFMALASHVAMIDALLAEGA